MRSAFRERFGFTSKLMIMVAVPLAALILVLGLEVADRLSFQRDLQSVVIASALVADAEEITHVLQRERGRSSLYLSSGGSLYREELISQRHETDRVIAALSSSLARVGDDQEGRFLVLHYSDLHEDLGEIDGMRRRILDLDVTWSESLAFYIDLVEQSYAASRGLDPLIGLDPKMTDLFRALEHLWDAEEAAGLERSWVSRALVRGTIEQSELDLVVRLVDRQELSLDSSNSHLPSGLRTSHDVLVVSREMSRVVAVRRQLAEGDFSFDPDAWFDISTAYVDTLHRASDDLLAHMVERSLELANDGRTAMWRFSAFGLLILTGSLLAAGRVGRRLSKRTIRLAGVARAIQEGDLSQRADGSGGDELGTLGVAFNQMTDDLMTLNRSLEAQVQERTAELRSSEARSQAMLEANQDLIVRVSPDGFYLDFIHTTAMASEGSAIFPPTEQFVGKHINEVLTPELAKSVLSANQRALETGEVQHLEYRFLVGGELRDREARLVPIPDSEETMVVVRDITERRAGERRVEEMIRARDEFVASISHELRTPLTAVIGFAELLQDTDSGLSPAEQEEMIQMITEQASDISNIVEDLLVAARTEMDTLHLAQVPVDLSAQLAQVLEASREASARHIEIVNGGAAALGDPGRVRQILRNLLSNAIRYGGEHIEVHMHTHGTKAFVQVRDDGPGVPEQDRETIFEAYKQSSSVPGLPGSVGLGLTVSRSLARLMGGDLTYRYHDGTSIFEVTLPVPE